MLKTFSNNRNLFLKYIFGFLALSWTLIIIVLVAWDFNHIAHTVTEMQAEFYLVGGLWAVGVAILWIGAYLFLQILEKQRQEERKYRVLFEASSVGITSIDRDGIVRDCNPTLCEIVGYSRHEIVGQLYTCFFSEGQIDLVAPQMERALRGEKFDGFVLKLVHKEGQIIWTENSITPINNGGTIEAVQTVTVDISHRKRAEKERELLAKIVEQSAESVILMDLEGNVEYVNPFFEEISGYAAEEVLGGSLRMLESGWQDDEFHASAWQTIQSGETWRGEFINKHKKGSLFTEKVIIFPIKDEAGEVISYAEIKQDISEQKRHDQEIETLSAVSLAMRSVEKRDELIRVILDELLALFNITGAALLLENITEDDAVRQYGAGAWDAWDETRTKQIVKINAQVLETGLLWERDDLQSNPNFSLELFNEMAMAICFPLIVEDAIIGTLWVGGKTPLEDDDLQIFTAIGNMAANAIRRQTLHENLIEQMAQLKLAQDSVIRAEKLSAMGELVAGVAHELNNPLTSVIFYAQSLLEQSLPAEHQRDLSKIVSAGQRAAHIVKDLRNFSRPQPPQHEMSQINDILTGSLGLLNYEMANNKISRETSFGADLPMVAVDTQQMQQVFINLLRNTFQAISQSKAQGRVKIITETGTSLLSDFEKDFSVVRIIIEDDGPGIASEALPNIFDPFFTTKAVGEGTGLGLSICHSIVDKHGGVIWATSEVGEGATFFIELPIAVAEDGDTEKMPVEEKRTKPAKREGSLLLIDDEESLLEILSRRLRRLGYTVDAVSSADAGLFALAQSPYDHILCDLRLPDMNGTELYQRVIREFPELAQRFIFMTGDVTSSDIAQSLAESAVPYLEKPFDIEALLALIEGEE